LDIYGTKDEGTREDQPSWKILQERRSLLITKDILYTDYMHGIAEVEQESNLSPTNIVNWDLLGSPEFFEPGVTERDPRISLTYRDVIKVSKLGSKLPLFARS